MGAPQADQLLPSTGHPNCIIFLARGNSIKEALAGYGHVFSTEVGGNTVHSMVVDPRFGTRSVLEYIVELGGVVYEPPQE